MGLFDIIEDFLAGIETKRVAKEKRKAKHRKKYKHTYRLLGKICKGLKALRNRAKKKVNEQNNEVNNANICSDMGKSRNL